MNEVVGGLGRPRREKTARTYAKTLRLQKRNKAKQEKINSPAYQIFSLSTQMHVVRDHEVMRPIDDFLIGLVRGLRTEGRISDETLKHDRAQGPPIALVSVSFLQENFGGDVIRRSNSRICLHAKRKGKPSSVRST